MIEVTPEMEAAARNAIAKGNRVAAGYRIIVKVLGAVSEMSEYQKEQFSTLAAAGFQDKSEDQRLKEENGSHYGIAVSIGEGAYKNEALGGKAWFKEGDVVTFDRYAGVLEEIPPGSKDLYRVMNDESVLTYMEVE